jgi:chloramphenicol 3-O-phosphotransferase
VKRLSIGLRVKRQDSGHTHFDVFTALAKDDDTREWQHITRIHVGSLMMRTDEFHMFAGLLTATADLGMDVHVDAYHHGEPEHPCLTEGGV